MQLPDNLALPKCSHSPRTAPKKRNRWQRGVDPLRQPIPHHRPVEFTGGLEAMPAAERKASPGFRPRIVRWALRVEPRRYSRAHIRSDRVLAWGANARYQLPQPPSSKACDSDVDRFLKSFFETRKGPDGKSLESLLGEPAAGLQLRRQLRVLVWFMCVRLGRSFPGSVQ